MTWQGTPWFKGENFINAAKMIPGNYFEWEAPIEYCTLRNMTNKPEVIEGKEYWKRDFNKAASLFLSQNVKMDLNILEKLIKEAYYSVLNGLVTNKINK